MIQVQARPFKNLADNFIALAASFFLLALFLCCMLLKLGTLTELRDVRERLSTTARVSCRAAHDAQLPVHPVLSAPLKPLHCVCCRPSTTCPPS